jgi:ketosteroid isomerase-like protein
LSAGVARGDKGGYVPDMPVPDDPILIVRRFNDGITTGDAGMLADLMTPDHTFIDTEGTSISGRNACLDAWREFFRTFPDYRNVFTSLTADGAKVTMTGYSACSVPELAGSALWTAVIRDDGIVQWQVYDDTVDNRILLGLPER